MAKQIARLLRTDVMADIDIPAIAQFLQSQGRRGDSILAHINAREAALLKKNGGAETVNPVTGLTEYYDVPNRVGFAEMTPRSAQYDLTQFNLPEAYDELNYKLDYPADGEIPYDLPEEPVTSSYYAPSSNLPYGATLDNSDIASANLRASSLQPIDSVGLSRDARVGLPAIKDLPALAPELTVPERIASAALGPSSLAARQAADREFAKEVREPGMVDNLSKTTGLSREALLRLGLAGLGTIQGIRAAREASAQGREARRETEAIAQPYVQRGRELTEQAARGELTAQGQQSLQALRARLAQGAEARGGVGAAQAAAQIEAFRQNLLQNQFDYGQKISNIGDQLMLGAIRTGLEADRYAANLSNTYFTNMARVAAGIPAGVPTGTQGAQ